MSLNRKLFRVITYMIAPNLIGCSLLYLSGVPLEKLWLAAWGFGILLGIYTGHNPEYRLINQDSDANEICTRENYVECRAFHKN